MPILTGVKFDRRQESQKTIVTTEFTTLTLCEVWNFIKTDTFTFLCPKIQKHGLTDDSCLHWQVSILTGVKNYKKLLSPLNSPPSICAEYKISSKLKHLLLFIQNYGLKDDTCQHWQVSRITKNYCLQWIQHLQIVHYAKFREKWLTSFPVPCSLFHRYLILNWDIVENRPGSARSGINHYKS